MTVSCVAGLAATRKAWAGLALCRVCLSQLHLQAAPLARIPVYAVSFPRERNDVETNERSNSEPTDRRVPSREPSPTPRSKVAKSKYCTVYAGYRGLRWTPSQNAETKRGPDEICRRRGSPSPLRLGPWSTVHCPRIRLKLCSDHLDVE